ncbi:glyoxylate/hydroxypyruvate reductase A [Loktanella ponticola]|uniref:Glyoxylate/hydroxypyruvate reductase A n=1 Tax=Yoonia ponticola TaxID=1524255 RepID=A0A7W9EYY9_9RHOB|nr:glyoxylate/hydroxypyruvate reductase A [Yoonia ponticola]MBB5723189.1 glyoxylate/hydroxypyruvate reductase A [Yoonia ponticola]
MVLNVLFAARDGLWPDYEAHLPAAFAKAGLDVNLQRDHAPEDVDYIIFAPHDGLTDFTPFTRAKAVLSLWAGVESIIVNETLTQPLTRMVNPGLTRGMVEWVTGHVLRHHLGMDRQILNQDGTWTPVVPPLAEDRKVTVLGLGALGAACATALTGLGFDVTGWSRSRKAIDGAQCLSGDAGMDDALRGAEIVVLLLPDTAATENALNTKSLALLAKGAFVVNPGRGPLIDDDALLAALDSGQVAHATLDVFRVEPLPAEHPFWAHPSVTVTPHIAAETRPKTAAIEIAANIARSERGEAMLHLVDRNTGY